MSGGSGAEATSRWARRFVLTGAGFLVAGAAADLGGAGRRSLVFLGLFGFILHTVFGKAYSLLPSYFDRRLATHRPMPVQLGLTAGGTALLAASAIRPAAWTPIAVAGAAAWISGVLVFLGTILWTLRDNLTGTQTGTGEANADRRKVDRLANAAVPVALLYLLVGSYGALANAAGFPGPFGYYPVVTHLLAAGTATLLVLGVGFRLLPRFLAVNARYRVAALVVPAGAVAPALLALGFAGESASLHGGAGLQALAVVGFAIAYADLFARSDRRRAGLYGVLLGAVAGVIAVLLGLDAALGRGDPAVLPLHVRLNVLGFLGLTVVGVSYQFYPPNAGTFRFADDRTGLAVIGFVATGLALQILETVTGTALSIGTVGRFAVLAGAAVHLLLLAGLFRERYGRP